MTDLVKTCRENDCKKTFVVTEGEQAFLRERFGDKYMSPTRCKTCRDRLRALREAEAQ